LIDFGLSRRSVISQHQYQSRIERDAILSIPIYIMRSDQSFISHDSSIGKSLITQLLLGRGKPLGQKFQQPPCENAGCIQWRCRASGSIYVRHSLDNHHKDVARYSLLKGHQACIVCRVLAAMREGGWKPGHSALSQSPSLLSTS